nr:toxin-antitoxin system YwqK family antitoxin [uncultured Allomuricauda sp.]
MIRTKPLFSLLIAFVVLSIGCTKQRGKSFVEINSDISPEVPNIIIEKSMLHYNPEISTWTLNGTPYSGFAISHYPNNTLKEKFGIFEGKKQNTFIQWYPDGHLKNLATYHRGKLHGEKKIWSDQPVHLLIAHYNYYKGKPHGKQTKWYPTGELFKKMNLNQGKEEGIQQAFRKNGVLYANYEAKAGRIFGMKKAKLCYSLEGENIKEKRK